MKIIDSRSRFDSPLSKNGLPMDRFFFVWAFFIVIFLSGGLYAQDGDRPVEEPAAPAAAPAVAPASAAPEGASATPSDLEPVRPSYLVWFVTALGPIFAPAFAITSVLFVMFVVMNAIAITRKNIAPQEMIEEFKQKLEEKNFQEAYEIAKESETPLGRILAAGLARMSGGYDAASQTMTDVADEEVMRMEQKLGYLALIGTISPMLGLLGTVVGMVQSFQVIAIQGTAPQASELAKGISTALITTEVGLFIAIPAMIAYELFRNRLMLLVLELSVQTENLMSRFKKS